MARLDYKGFAMEYKSVDLLPQPQATEMSMKWHSMAHFCWQGQGLTHIDGLIKLLILPMGHKRKNCLSVNKLKAMSAMT